MKHPAERKAKCMFCRKKTTLYNLIRIGKKQICIVCIRRLDEMLRFHRGQI